MTETKLQQIKLLVHASLSPFWRPISRWTWFGQYQNVSILDFIGAKDDGGGGDNWSYKTCKVPVKSSPLNENTRTRFTTQMKKCSEATQTLHAGCSKADPQTNKQTNTQTDRGDYNTLCSLARSVITGLPKHRRSPQIT